MKVYFSGSLHNSGITKDNYRKIISVIKDMGHDIKFNHILDVSTEDLQKQNHQDYLDYYEHLGQWMNWGDVIVAEVSYPSTINIGHEVTKWLDFGKPVIGLYQQNREPGILQGNASGKLILTEYNDGSLNDLLRYALNEAGEWLSTRFTMIMPADITHYLNQLSGKGTNRSEFIRNLIREKMEKK